MEQHKEELAALEALDVGTSSVHLVSRDNYIPPPLSLAS